MAGDIPLLQTDLDCSVVQKGGLLEMKAHLNSCSCLSGRRCSGATTRPTRESWEEGQTWGSGRTRIERVC